MTLKDLIDYENFRVVTEAYSNDYESLISKLNEYVVICDKPNNEEDKLKQFNLETPSKGGKRHSLILIKINILDFLDAIINRTSPCLEDLDINFWCIASLLFLIRDIKNICEEDIKPDEGVILYVLYAMENSADPRIEPEYRNIDNITKYVNKIHTQTLEEHYVEETLYQLSQLSCTRVQNGEWSILEKLEIEGF